jgi:hypothetical protein
MEDAWKALCIILLAVIFVLVLVCFQKSAKGSEIVYVPPHYRIHNEMLGSTNLVLIPTKLAFRSETTIYSNVDFNSVTPYLRKGGNTLIKGVTSIANYPLYNNPKEGEFGKDCWEE